MGSRKNNFKFAAGVKPVTVVNASDEPSIPSPAPSALSDDPLKARISISPQAIALQRRETLRRFSQLRKQHSAYKAARIVGASVTTLWLWQTTFEKRGLAGLRPRSACSGKRSPLRNVRLTAQAVRELELLHVEHTAHQAWRKFASSPVCPPVLARMILRQGGRPVLIGKVGQIQPVAGKCFVSMDGHRLYVKLPARATLTTKLVMKGKLRLIESK